jgi:hypothetical protein
LILCLWGFGTTKGTKTTKTIPSSSGRRDGEPKDPASGTPGAAGSSDNGFAVSEDDETFLILFIFAAIVPLVVHSIFAALCRRSDSC